MPRRLEPIEAGLQAAAERLRAGGLVAFPTETVYGLGADAFDSEAIGAAFELKGRPADNPLIAHVTGAEQAKTLTDAWDARCDDLTEKFWPGPLTLVVHRAPGVPDALTAGLETVAIRSPLHLVARRLMAAFGGPIAAPSANRSGRPSPTTAEHVAEDFRDALDLMIIDGGPCDIGIESTVLDLSGEVPRLLRPGGVPVDELQAVLGEIETSPLGAQDASPGTSAAHYAPATPAACVAGSDLASHLAGAPGPVAVLCFDGSGVAAPHVAIEMPSDSDAYAARLYDALRRADRMALTGIVIERPPNRDGLWEAVHDRLDRATA